MNMRDRIERREIQQKLARTRAAAVALRRRGGSPEVLRMIQHSIVGLQSALLDAHARAAGLAVEPVAPSGRRERASLNPAPMRGARLP
jgi:hypothetical protein